MTHDERLEYAQKLNYAGMGMIVSGFGCFAGLCGGLWGSIGAGAIGAAFGGASGLVFGSMGPFSASKEVLKWDKEIEEGKKESV